MPAPAPSRIGPKGLPGPQPGLLRSQARNGADRPGPGSPSFRYLVRFRPRAGRQAYSSLVVLRHDGGRRRSILRFFTGTSPDGRRSVASPYRPTSHLMAAGRFPPPPGSALRAAGSTAPLGTSPPGTQGRLAGTRREVGIVRRLTANVCPQPRVCGPGRAALEGRQHPSGPRAIVLPALVRRLRLCYSVA